MPIVVAPNSGIMEANRMTGFNSMQAQPKPLIFAKFKSSSDSGDIYLQTFIENYNKDDINALIE